MWKNRLGKAVLVVVVATLGGLVAAPAHSANAAGAARPTGIENIQVSLYARHSQKCMDVRHASRDDGAIVEQYQCNHTGAQLWNLIFVGDRYYEVVNGLSGKCLHVEGAWVGNGVPIKQYHCDRGISAVQAGSAQ